MLDWVCNSGFDREVRRKNLWEGRLVVVDSEAGTGGFAGSCGLGGRK
jgi:hypothetical protein